MSSPRTVLLEAVRDCLVRIRTVDGYSTDAGLDVTLEPAPAVAEDKNAFVTALWERQERPADPGLARAKRLTTFRVLAKVPADMDEAQGKLDLIVDDIERAMADQQFRYPVGYGFPTYVSAEPLAAEVTAGWVGVVITYTSHVPIRATTP